MIQNGLRSRVYGYFKINPGSAFIIAFELLLIGVATELWEGNNQVADELGVAAFILACVGIGLQTLASIRTRAANPTISPSNKSSTGYPALNDEEVS